jgi:hypothetical protein
MSSVAVQAQPEAQGTLRTRLIAAGVGAVVVFDVIWVRAPFLLTLGIPFVVASLRYRDRHATTRALLVAFCLLYVVLGVSFAASNGLRAPAEPGEVARSTINPGDFAFVYIGTPLAAWLGVRLTGQFFGRNRSIWGAEA